MTAAQIYGHIDFPLLLILGETLIARFFNKRDHFILRYVLFVALTIGSNFALYFLVHIANNFALNICSAFIVFLFSLIGLIFTYKATIASYLLAANVGYCLQNTSYCLTSLLRIAIGFNETNQWYFMMIFLTIIFFLYTFLFNNLYLSKPEKVKGIGQVTEKRQIIITFISCIAISILSTSGMYVATNLNSTMAWTTVYCFNICVGIISLTSELELLTSREKIKEVAKIKARYEKDIESLNQSAENYELINIKMHDLRHRLDNLSSKLEENEIESLKQSIGWYCQSVKTNCRALDIVLQEKSAAIINNKIRLTCLMDGEKINYIPKEILYSLFENALSNSIEAVIKLPEEKRLISIKGVDLGDYLNIHIENYSEPQKDIDIGSTSKADKIYHGYGLKSIKNIMEQYHGMFSYHIKEDIFSLDLFFSLKE